MPKVNNARRRLDVGEPEDPERTVDGWGEITPHSFGKSPNTRAEMQPIRVDGEGEEGSATASTFTPMNT